jgi:uncharacterized protein YecE (DUF72 family)
MPDDFIRLGTSSFTASGWSGSFYPAGMRSEDYLSYYAEQFDTVEIDATFYACPSAPTVRGWYSKTPEKFLFSAKVPQTITHERVLVGCDAELKEFLDTMDLLGTKLGPLVFQFPFFPRGTFRDGREFLDRLVPMLAKLPAEHQFAIELRNKDWLDGRMADLFRRHKTALVLQDRSWMADPLTFDFDPVTADFTYIRWLGNRKQIEAMTQMWDKIVVDRTAELNSWVDYCQPIAKRGVTVYAYANNHFQGHGPATIAKFIELWNGKGLPQIAHRGATQPGLHRQAGLFD